MTTDYIEKSTTRFIKSKTIYPKGANSPTIRNYYKCLCGRGKIVEESVPGFDDSFAYFKCRRCNKKYSYIEFTYEEWIVYKKD